MEDPNRQPSPHVSACPECGRPVDDTALLSPGLLQCPSCGAQFFATSESEEPDEDSERESRLSGKSQAERELSELHIRQVRDLRRGANRTRSWLAMGALVSLVVAAQLALMAVQSARARGWHLIPIGFLLAALAAVLVAVRFVQKAIETTREIRQMSVPPPSDPPDLSTLSDGSQRWKNLEDMQLP